VQIALSSAQRGYFKVLQGLTRTFAARRYGDLCTQVMVLTCTSGHGGSRRTPGELDDGTTQQQGLFLEGTRHVRRLGKKER
jgi:hypothetical protein